MKELVLPYACLRFQIKPREAQLTNHGYASILFVSYTDECPCMRQDILKLLEI